MSFRKKLRLQPLELTIHCGNEESRRSKVARGSNDHTAASAMEMQHQTVPAGTAGTETGNGSTSINDGDCWPSSINWDELPSSNSINEEAKVKAWESVRYSLRNAVVESAAMPYNQLCVLCAEAVASIRCLQCGPNVYYCHDCLHTFQALVLGEYINIHVYSIIHLLIGIIW